MTNLAFCLAGLPENPDLWLPQDLLLYMLLLSGLNSLVGTLVVHFVSGYEIFSLPRFGYCCWFRRILSNVTLVVIVYATCIYLLTVFFNAGALFLVTISAIVYLLNGIAISWLQALLIAYNGNGLVSFSLVTLAQLLSIFCSQNLAGNWKIILPGNLAMISRSTLALSNGFSINMAIMLELFILLTIWNCGWRLLRKVNRKVR